MSDDIQIMESIQTWGVPPVDRIRTIANTTNTTMKYNRIYNIESSTNRFIYRPVSSSASSSVFCGDVRITYCILPVSTTVVSIVARLSCTNATHTANSTSTRRSCSIKSYSTNENNAFDEFDDNVPFHLIERGNYTLNDLYKLANRATIRSMTRPLALACMIGIYAAFFEIGITSGSSIPFTYIRARITRIYGNNNGSNKCFCEGFGFLLLLAIIESFSIGLFLFSMIWIVHLTALSIMIPLAIMSFIIIVFLHCPHSIIESCKNDSTSHTLDEDDEPTAIPEIPESERQY